MRQINELREGARKPEMKEGVTSRDVTKKVHKVCMYPYYNLREKYHLNLSRGVARAPWNSADQLCT